MRFTRALGMMLAMVYATSAHALDVYVENYAGNVDVVVATSGSFGAEHSTPSRDPREDDCSVKFVERRYELACKPKDGARVDVSLRVPFGSRVSVKTGGGDISLEGFPAEFTASTNTGALDLACPWEATKFLFYGALEPRKIETPKDYKLRSERSDIVPGINWIMEDKLPLSAVTYGRVRVRAEKASAVRLRNIEIPEDSLVKMPWQAEEIVKRLIESGNGDRPSRPGPAGAPPARKPKRKARVLAHASLLEEPNVAPAAGESGDGPEEEETPLFRSDVRMVTLSAAVYDSEGRPLVGLGKDDFTVIEEGQIQKIDSAQSEEAPFNLVILLDLSASTRHGREDMKEIAEGFVRITRPQDKVAVYALFNNWFSVITPLTDDVGAALVQIDTIPKLTGATPLYDAIALAWNEELAQLKGQRNAMIVITDGQDNRFAGTGVPSKVSDDELAEAAKHMETLIYPIFLGEPVDTYDKNSWGMKAYERIKKIAAASGGRVFEVGLEQDRAMLYGQVADELRSVYSVAFYPDNQDFSGDFREVDILVNRVGATVRAREGYYAEQ